MARRALSTFLSLALIAAFSTSAFAQDTPPAAPAPAAAPAAQGGPPGLTLNQGQIKALVMFEINLLKGFTGKPFSIAPDIMYGLMQGLTVGLVHSGMTSTGFADGYGNGICIGGATGGCGKAYGNTGLNAWYSLMNGPFSLAVDAGLYFRYFDPFTMSAKLGVVGRVIMGALMIHFAPNIYIGITERDPGLGGVGGNKERLHIPLMLAYMLMPNFGVGLQTGIRGPLDGFGDGWSLPVIIGAQYWFNKNLGALFTFGFNRLAGGGPGGAADAKSINLAVIYKTGS